MRYWLSNNDGKTVGPHTLDEIRSLAASNALSPEAQVCPENSTDWTSAATVLGTTPPTVPVPGLVPTGCCCLCGGTSNRKATKSLYGHPVCKKCFWAFANRRQGAFVIDYVTYLALVYTVDWIFSAATGRVLPPDRETYQLHASVIAWILFVMFLAKDANGGRTFGRLLCGVGVIDRFTGAPIGLGASIKRNLPLLIPFIALFVAFQLCRGHRIGDGWSRSKVIWKRYATNPAFGPESGPG